MKQQGTSLIEILLVIATVGILILILGNLPNSINLIGKSNHHSVAREVAVKQLEDKRAITYDNLSYGEVAITDSRLNLLPGGSGKVEVLSCDTVTVCPNGELLKKVSVTISWQDSGKDQKIVLDTLVGKGGLD